jgi:copper(I)-binding protein
MRKVLLLASFFLLATTAMSNANAITEIAAQVVKVQSPEVRSNGANAAEGFMTIENTGTQNHILVAAYSPTDAQTMLHKDVVKNGQLTMKEVSQILIPARESTHLTFSGLHIMLMGMNQPLPSSGSVPIGLIFDDGSELNVSAKIIS